MPTAWFTTGGSTSGMTSSPQSTASAGTQSHSGAQHVTFIHSSDFQLGMTRWFLDDDAQSRFDDSRLRAIARLGDLAEGRTGHPREPPEVALLQQVDMVGDQASHQGIANT